MAEAHAALSTVLLERRDAVAAETHARRALDLEPRDAEARYNLALALAAQDKLTEAAAHYERFLDDQPEHVEARFSLGLVRRDLKQVEAAAAAFRRVIELEPTHVKAMVDLGIATYELGRPDEARSLYLRALETTANNPAAYNNLALLAMRSNQLAEAEEYARQAVALAPGRSDMHFTLSNVLLVGGRLGEGWREYEWRPQRADDNPPIWQPQWIGGPIEGQTILLRFEQGLGDTLQFIRYARLVKERGATVVVECQQSVAKLVAGCAGVDRVIVRGEPLGEFDAFSPLLSLPRVFGTTLDTIPSAEGYLAPEPAAVERWREELAGFEGLKIGIAWQGSPTNLRDRFRSMRLEEFAPLTKLEGVRLFSLQAGPGRDQVAGFAARWPIVDLGDRLGDFAETAAIVRNLDLVVTCDSSTAHLAGAIGALVWVALTYSPDWRFMLEREDYPWYRSMRLFRQHIENDWPAVFERIAAAIRER